MGEAVVKGGEKESVRHAYSDRATFVVALAAWLSLSLGFGTAHAGHGDIGQCGAGGGADKQQLGVGESTSLPSGRDGVRMYLRVIDPSPNVTTAFVRSVYVAESSIDAVEFGWKWTPNSNYLSVGETLDSAPTTFSVRLYAGSYSISEGNPSNPGTGTLAQESDHRFSIYRNQSGSEPERFDMYRNGDFYGYYNQGRMTSGGFVAAITEGFGPCEDMQTHAWTMEKKNDPSGSWLQWSGVYKKGSFSFNTPWWYHDKTNSPPEWWIKHCGSSDGCPDAAP